MATNSDSFRTEMEFIRIETRMIRDRNSAIECGNELLERRLALLREIADVQREEDVWG